MDTGRSQELRERYDRRLRLERRSHSHVCADCGNPLVLAMVPPEPEPQLLCGTDRGHVGIRKPRYTSYTEEVKVPGRGSVILRRYKLSE